MRVGRQLSSPRPARASGAAGVAIRFATSIPPSGARTQEIVFVTGADVTDVYDFEASTSAFTHTAQVLTADLTGEWLTPNAPSHGNVIASWWAYENPHGWIRGAADTCNPVTVHRVYITASLVHPRSTAYGDCALFLAPVAFTTFPPFALPRAPSVSDFGGAFYWSDELWVIAP